MEKLKTIRIDRGMTQEELANKIGCSRVHITNVENGRMHLSIPKLKKAAIELKVTLEQLID